MSEFQAQFRGQHEIDVLQPSTGRRWHYLVATKGPGRRRLDGPVGVMIAASDDKDLLRQVHDFAHTEAMKAGRIDA